MMTFWETVVRTNGPQKQKIKAMEEMAELIHAISRDLTNETDRENLAEEMADVSIMLEQLLIIYGNWEDVYRLRRLKEDRMRRRMERMERIERMAKGGTDGLQATP